MRRVAPTTDGDGQAVVSLAAITARAREVVERHTQAFRVAREAALQERNKVVAALSKMFPAGTTPTAIAGWKDDWHGCVYIDLPTGQVSWHYHDRDADLFAHLPPYHTSWDGHDTPEKYRRLADLKAG